MRSHFDIVLYATYSRYMVQCLNRHCSGFWTGTTFNFKYDLENKQHNLPAADKVETFQPGKLPPRNDLSRNGYSIRGSKLYLTASLLFVIIDHIQQL